MQGKAGYPCLWPESICSCWRRTVTWKALPVTGLRIAVVDLMLLMRVALQLLLMRVALLLANLHLGLLVCLLAGLQ